MDSDTGGNPLCGEVSIQGSKNAALPIMAASVLVPGRYGADELSGNIGCILHV